MKIKNNQISIVHEDYVESGENGVYKRVKQDEKTSYAKLIQNALKLKLVALKLSDVDVYEQYVDINKILKKEADTMEFEKAELKLIVGCVNEMPVTTPDEELLAFKKYFKDLKIE